MRQLSVVLEKTTTWEVAVRRAVKLLTLSCIAVGLVAGSAIAAGSAGTYGGKTAQKRAVKLKVSAKQAKLMNFTIELKCKDGSTLVDQESGFEPSILRNGKFSDVQVGSGDTVKYSGKVKGAKVTGTLKVTDKVGKVRCVSPNVKFTARRK